MNATQLAEEWINAMNTHDLERMATILTENAVGDHQALVEIRFKAVNKAFMGPASNKPIELRIAYIIGKERQDCEHNIVLRCSYATHSTWNNAEIAVPV